MTGSFQQAIEFLAGLGRFGMRPGLATTRTLARSLGNPHRKLRFIHVAGTNGKGSTCAMLESIYRNAEYRVGLFTSPHLVRFTERIQVNREEIPEVEVVRLLGLLRAFLADFAAVKHPLCPTFFEFTTVLALQHFVDRQCDLVIWETGLGGRLDATNIVRPLATLITNIGWDHQAWLGNTLAKIASEKAGIIKRGVPVFSAVDVPEALDVIRDRAIRTRSPFTLVTAQLAHQFPYTIPLVGAHQRMNAALVLETVLGLRSLLPVNPAAIANGFGTINWPGRFQVVQRGQQRWILDGAHNVPGLTALSTTLQEQFPSNRFAFLIGMLADKDCTAMCEIIAPLASRVILSEVAGTRSASPDMLSAILRKIRPDLPTEIFGLPNAFQALAGEPLVVVTGSLSFLGEVFVELEKESIGSRRETRLNDYAIAAPPKDRIGTGR